MLLPVPLLFTLPLLTAGPDPASDPIPELDTRGDVYKTEGPNDPLIYDSTTGSKKMILLYTDFADLKVENDTREVGETVLGGDRFEELFRQQSHGTLEITVDHVHGWRQLPKKQKDYDARTTETHREMFIDVFALYPEVDFTKYDYIVAKMPGRGNFAFGERDDKAIPYKDGKINVAVNIGSNNPIVLAHEVAHLMGLPDLYTIGDLDPKNPVGSWDIMSDGNRSTGFLGWHRHKLGWLAPERKDYLVGTRHDVVLTPLDAESGTSMVVIPADDPAQPTTVFVIEVGQPPSPKKDAEPWPAGVLVYRVDATRETGKNPVVIFPKENIKEGAPWHPGDTVDHEDLPFRVKVVKKRADGAYELEIESKG